MRALEREVMLQLIDQKWREHLSEMDYLREGIGLRAMGQQDPLVAWQRDGYEMFGQLMSGIDDDYVKIVMHAQVQVLAADPPRRGRPSWPAPSTRHPTTRSRGPAGCSGPWRPDRRPARRSCSPRHPRKRKPPPRRPRPSPEVEKPVVRDSAFERAGRNDPCPCGSGKKFKFCHGR